MMDLQNSQESAWSAGTGLETPFAESGFGQEVTSQSEQPLLTLSEETSPFAEAAMAGGEGEGDRMFAELLEELRDEAFHEAVSFLAEETERDIADHFIGESGSFPAERERFAEARLAEVRYEAEQYFDSLESGLTNLDVAGLGEDQLDEILERFDPQARDLTPAGEEFIGALARKAKKALKGAVNIAKKIGSLANPIIGPILKKLKGLINPLLKRVLAFAIGRLPAPLRPAARKLAARFTSEAPDHEEEMEGESGEEMSPANLTDTEELADQFDEAVAEAIAGGAAGEQEEEVIASEGERDVPGSGELIALAEARGVLIDRLGTVGPNEELEPAMEQFIPALLGALRLGINLIGRPKVVGFLAGYLAQLIRKWVDPETSRALSNAIVDTGLRLISLEAEEPGASEALEDREAAPAALAAVVEDTVRRLSENEEFVFEDEGLMQLATAEAFTQAVSSHFPSRLVRDDLRRAPSLGGTFVSRRPRSVRAYHKYSRAPEIEITPQIADALPSFGGSSLGAAMRAQGRGFPMKARMHIFQAAPGTTLSAIGRTDRSIASLGPRSSRHFHPLTPHAAGILLREPQLGAAVPRRFLRSPTRIAAGQRVYVLQPVGPAPAASRSQATRAWLRVHPSRGGITVGVYFSEADAQRIADVVRRGRSPAALLKAIVETCRTIGLASVARRVQREDKEEFEEFAGPLGRRIPRAASRFLRRRVAAWVFPAISKWASANSEAFLRAAAHPAEGVTVRARISAIPGFDLLRRGGAGSLEALRRAFAGRPSIAVSVAPGHSRA